MVNAFRRSKVVAFYVGIPLAVITFILVWIIAENRIADQMMRSIVSLSLAVFVFGTTFLISRAMAVRDYQRLLPAFYVDLDPGRMIDSLEALDEKALNADERSANDLHRAGGYIYLGQTGKAEELLEGISIPPHDLDTRFLILGNLATCALMAEDTREAKKRIEALEALAKDKRSNQSLAVRVGRVSGYLRMCLDIQRGRDVDISIMEEDFETSPVPTHRLDAAYHIALYMRLHGDEAGSVRYIEYIKEHGSRTVYPSLLGIS